jgi:hypothetical protein
MTSGGTNGFPVRIEDQSGAVMLTGRFINAKGEKNSSKGLGSNLGSKNRGRRM